MLDTKALNSFFMLEVKQLAFDGLLQFKRI